MQRSSSTDQLFDIIRKDLSKIITEAERQENEAKAKEGAKKEVKKSIKSNEKHISGTVPKKAIGKKNQKPNVQSTKTDQRKSLDGKPTTTTTANSSPRTPQKSPSPTRSVDANPATKSGSMPKPIDISKQVESLGHPLPRNIDEEVQKMQVDLMECYELFRSIGEKLESINFGRLQSRIKDLNLSTKRDFVGNVRADELKEALEQGFKTNRLDKVTSEMGEKFRTHMSNHPGEFADIPELSTFFQACSQLEHGLENLKSQRTGVDNLGSRIRKAANTNYQRISEIQRELKQVQQEAATEEKNNKAE